MRALTSGCSAAPEAALAPGCAVAARPPCRHSRRSVRVVAQERIGESCQQIHQTTAESMQGKGSQLAGSLAKPTASVFSKEAASHQGWKLCSVGCGGHEVEDGPRRAPSCCATRAMLLPLACLPLQAPHLPCGDSTDGDASISDMVQNKGCTDLCPLCIHKRTAGAQLCDYRCEQGEMEAGSSRLLPAA